MRFHFMNIVAITILRQNQFTRGFVKKTLIWVLLKYIKNLNNILKAYCPAIAWSVFLHGDINEITVELKARHCDLSMMQIRIATITMFHTFTIKMNNLLT